MGTKLMTTALALVLTAPAGLALAQEGAPAPAGDPAAQTGATAPGMTTAPAVGETGDATTGTMGGGDPAEAGAAATTPAEPATGGTTGEATGGATTATTAGETTGGGWWSGMRGNEIVGQTLYGAGGEQIGDIDNVVLSAEGDRPAAIVGVGGFLGIGQRDVTIPLDDIERGPEDRLTTSMTRDQIGGLEAYEEGSGGWRPFRGDGTLGGGTSG